MLVGMVILFIWFVGYTLAIYPIYAALMRTHTTKVAKDNADRYAANKNITQGDTIQGMVGASFIAIVWFLTLPYYISHMIHNRHKPTLDREIESFEEEFKHKQELKRRLASARKELEVEFKEKW